MLQYLHIENIAVIEQASIDFSLGFNVLTGETGAGKSIIIDSLYAVLGERTSRELIRHGCKQASVTAGFSNINSAALNKLTELGIDYTAGEELIIKRTITDDGHGKVRINMQPVTVTALKELGKYLVNIHGQFDNQGLLNPEKHIEFVDAFAANDELRERYRDCFTKLRSISKELDAVISGEEENKKRYNLLNYQAEEINAAGIKPGEIEKLKEYLGVQHSSEHLLQALTIAEKELFGVNESDELTAIDKINLAVKNIETVSENFENVKPLFERLSAVSYELEDICSALSETISVCQYDSEGVAKATERLEYLKDIVSKYGGSEENALEFLQKASSEIESIKSTDKRRNILQNELESAEKDLIEAGSKLTDSRKKALDAICKNISAELQYLDFKSALFTADFEQGRYTKNGCDTVEFLISANIGEQPKPIAKIASGGELSRIMLAIRCVLSLSDDVDTLVFDEIDSGISGHAAVKVAEKLKEVSKKRQVVCVTHLAQIASAGDMHLLIEKSENNGRTFTDVTPLDGEARVREIARIMSGANYSDTILASAREMLNK